VRNLKFAHLAILELLALYVHLYSSETLIAINNGNKFKQQKKALEKNYVALVP